MEQSSDLFGDSIGAEFSPCRQYRYRLWRVWGTRPVCLFIMLNPSTAAETTNDPTVTRCIGFAKKWGYGGCVVANLFAYRATNPKEMKSAKDPIGPENDKYILQCAADAGIVMYAWGLDGKHMGRSHYVRGMLHEAGIKAYCLSVTAEGEPGHPLYLRGDLQPKLLPYEAGTP